MKQLNKYLKYFPVPLGKRNVQSLPEDNLIEIIDNAKPLEYHQQMLQNNYNPYSKSVEEFVQYIERMEVSTKIGTALSKVKPATPLLRKERKGALVTKKKLKKRNFTGASTARS